MWKGFLFRSLKKQRTFRDATNGFPAKWRLRNDCRLRWLVEANFPRGTANQKHYPELGSDASSVWNFSACFSDVIARGNRLWRREMSSVFSGYFFREKMGVGLRGGTSPYKHLLSPPPPPQPPALPFMLFKILVKVKYCANKLIENLRLIRKGERGRREGVWRARLMKPWWDLCDLTRRW